MANIYTDLLKLRKPALGDVGWDDEVNDNTEIAEFVFGSILKSNVILNGLEPTDGGGLDVDVAAGNAVVGGTSFAVGAGSKTCTSGVKNWLYIDDAGALQVATLQPTGDYAAVALIDAGSTTITRVADCRNMVESAGDADSLGGFTAASFQRPALTDTDGDAVDASGDWDDYLAGGFFRGDGLTNETPFKTHTWQYTLILSHATDYCVQIAKGYNDPDPLSMRIRKADVWSPWREIWSDINDGPGSGLDADTVDGLEASQFVRSDANDQINGALSVESNRDNAGDTTPGPGNFSLEVAAGTAYIGIGQNNGLAVLQPFGVGTGYNLTLCPVAGEVRMGSGHKAWHAGNDGAGSGLDADTVDGVHAVSFVRKDAESFINSSIGLCFGSGPGAVRLLHDAVNNRFYLLPHGASDWLWGKQLVFDADEGQWDIEGAPTAGGNQIATVADPFLQGFKNRIINGNFDIWQRGSSQTSSGYGSDDRWLNTHTGATKTHSRQDFTVGQSDVPGNPKYFSRTAITAGSAAGDYCTKIQRVEGVRTLAGGKATLTFWAKADAAKNIAVEFVQAFGGGGSPSATNDGIEVTTCALSTSWQKFTITLDVPSISGKTLGTNEDDTFRVYFWLDAGSSFDSRTNTLGHQSITFDLAQVQIEAGEVATPFEQRPYSVEFHLCKRYYERFDYDSTNWVGASVVFHASTFGVISGLACEVEKRTGLVDWNIQNIKYRINSTRYGFTATSWDLAHDKRILHIVGSPATTPTAGASYPLESTNNLLIEIDAEL